MLKFLIFARNIIISFYLNYCRREEVIKAAFFVGISGSNSTVINFATETALTVEEVTAALDTVTLKDSTTFAEITFKGEISTVMRKVDLQQVTFSQKVTKESFENITKIFQATWEQQFPGKFRIAILLSVTDSVLHDTNIYYIPHLIIKFSDFTTINVTAYGQSESTFSMSIE